MIKTEKTENLFLECCGQSGSHTLHILRIFRKHNRCCKKWWLVSCFLLATAVMGCAADDIRNERVHFKKGANSAVVEASIKGYETVDYVLGARAGQHLNVSLATKHGATYFNILAPGENEVALFNGSTSQNQYEGTLAVSGDYKIRVYMMRSAARRNEVAHYRLEMIIDGVGQSAVHATSHDAVLSGG